MKIFNEDDKQVSDMIDVISNHYGKDHQLDITIEECSELIKSISKYKRRSEYDEDMKIIFKGNMIEELADVYITIRQLCHLYDCEDAVSMIVQAKLKRQIYRMKNQSDEYEE